MKCAIIIKHEQFQQKQNAVKKTKLVFAFCRNINTERRNGNGSGIKVTWY